MSHGHEGPTIHGVAAQFHTSDEVIAAAEAATSAGYTRMDGYSPVPVDGLYEAMGRRKSILGWIILCGGLLGGFGGFYLQYWISAIDYPVNVGGRPMFSWPAWIPVIFECTVLASALTAFFGMWTMNGLPQPYHPIFNAEGFDSASRDKYWLCIEAEDEKFDEQEVTAFLKKTNPESICTVDL